MNKRGIMILAIAIAAAIGVIVWLKSGRDKASQTQSAQTGAAPVQTATKPARVEPARVVVTITSAKGAIANATVRLERDRGDVTMVQTGADGIARAAGLEPGTWRISAAAEGHEPAAARARELKAGETVNLEIKLEPGGRTLTGLVSDATGGPIGGARIDAAKLGSSARPTDAVASTLTGADGRYKLTVSEGQVLVAASEASYAPQSRFVEIGPSGATADFQLVPGGVIEGVVRDERTREPVAGALVFANRDAPAMLLGERAVHRAMAGSDGRFRITGLRPGAYDLAARAELRASRATTTVGLGVAEQVSDVELIIGTAPVIRGVVVDETGAPAAGVEVSALSRGGNDASATADAKGAFVLEGLEAGRYMLIGRSDAFLPAGPTRVELAAKDVDGVKITVRRGLRIKGHVERRQVCDVSIELDDDAMGAGHLPMMIAPVATGPDGEFDIGPVSPISYELAARCPSGEQGNKRVDVKPALADVVIDVKPGASIAGKVVDGAGKPVGGVTVMAAPQGDTERTTIVNGMMTGGVQALTNAAGAFELRGLAAATYRLRVLDRGRPLPMKSEAKVTLTAVEKKTGVTLAVDRPDGVIRGTVVGADGKPIPDAWVSVHQDIRDMIGDPDREGGGKRMVMVEVTDDGGDTGGTPPALTDEHGKFELRNLPRVPWTVIAEAQGGTVRGRAVKVVPDADIQLQALGVTKLEGRVIVQGAMPPTFHVELEGPTEAERSFASPDGTFSFARVDAGEYTVNVTSASGNGTAKVKVSPGQTSKVEVVLAANAVVVGKLVDPAGKPLGGLPVAIIPDSGDGRLRVQLTGPPPTSNPDGTFRLEAKAGPSALIVLTPPAPTSKKGLMLEAGKTLDVGSITVAAAGGAPPP